MFLETYTSRTTSLPPAADAVTRGEGKIFPLVVSLKEKEGTGRELRYGFFFEDSEGKLWDIVHSYRTSLKTLAREDKVMTFLRTIYPDAIGFSLPVLEEENVVTPGMIATAPRFLPIFPPKKVSTKK